jgi:hypothetical protein
MGKFRFQFTLRTVFLFSFLVAIACSLIKCELEARKNFASVTETVKRIVEDGNLHEFVDMSLYSRWAKKASDNPSISHFYEQFPGRTGQTGRLSTVLSFDGSGEVCSGNYLSGISRSWIIRKENISPNTDFTKRTRQDDYSVAIDVTVTCHRPCSIVSQKTSITIVSHNASLNSILLKRLKAFLDQEGLNYEIKED